MWDKINAGGFLAGYKTYLLVALALLCALAQWATGEITLADLIFQAPQLLGISSIATLRMALARMAPPPRPDAPDEPEPDPMRLGAAILDACRELHGEGGQANEMAKAALAAYLRRSRE
jgi:hypothetical protein